MRMALSFICRILSWVRFRLAPISWSVIDSSPPRPKYILMMACSRSVREDKAFSISSFRESV